MKWWWLFGVALVAVVVVMLSFFFNYNICFILFFVQLRLPIA